MSKRKKTPEKSSIAPVILGWCAIAFGVASLTLILTGSNFLEKAESLKKFIIFGFSFSLVFYLGEKVPLSDESRWNDIGGGWKKITFGCLVLLTALHTVGLLNAAITRETYTLIFSLIILPIPVAWYLFFKQADKAYPVVGILIFAHLFLLLNIR